ncbi:MAG: hypothetical protein U0271_01470 [Polyangiaceae bacterium]
MERGAFRGVAFFALANSGLSIFLIAQPVAAAPSLPTSASAPVELTTPSGLTATVRLHGASPVPGAESTRGTIYRGALPKADLVLRTIPLGFEDLVIFARPPEHATLRYDITLGDKVAGLRLVANTLELLDASGAPRLRAAAPWLADARGERRAATLTVEDCAVDTSPRAPWGRPTTAPGARVCSVRVDWTDAGLTYPIVIDPAWTESTTGAEPHIVNAQLHDERIMAAGPSTVELFDPATETWAMTASLNTRRSAPSIAVLADGRVLVASDGATPSSAEVYDPIEGTWSLTHWMRNQYGWPQQATLLLDGRVLVTSGDRKTELYLPASNTWVDTGAMASVRVWPQATLLLDGRVLVTGVNLEDPLTPSAELYDPVTGVFTSAGPMNEPRFHHTAARLSNGSVLIVGGYVGVLGDSALTAEVFDPTTNSFTTLPSAGTGSAGAACTLQDGTTLIAGGPPNHVAVVDVAAYDPVTETWLPEPSLLEPRTGHSAFTLRDGRVVVLGGGNFTDDLKTVEILDTRQAVGGPCNADAECATSHCADGVCCESACGGDATDDCTACSLVRGASADGVCTTLPDGTECATGHCAVGACESSAGGAGMGGGGVTGGGGSAGGSTNGGAGGQATGGSAGGGGGPSDGGSGDGCSGCSTSRTGRTPWAIGVVALWLFAARSRRRRSLGGAATALAAFGIVSSGCRVDLDNDSAVTVPDDAAAPLTSTTVRLGRNAAEPFELSDPASGLAVKVRLTGAAPNPAEVRDAGALYRGAGPDGGDLELRLVEDGVEDYVTIPRRTSDSVTVRYTLELAGSVRGLRLVDDTLELLDARGVPRLRAAPPTWTDASGQRGRASLRVEDCAYDDSPLPPWRRPPVAPGATHCSVRVDAAPASATYPIVIDPMWTLTGSMVVAGASTLTLLDTGEVLAVGNNQSTTCSLYSPSSGVWTVTGSNVLMRSDHTASLLDDGRVLVAGGDLINGGLDPSTSELYDPSAGTWSLAGSMITRVDRHAATVLEDGRVLVTGGYDALGYTTTTQLYRPATNDWVSAAHMHDGRSYHQSTLLLDGRVLVTGGVAFVGTTSTTELYDPATNQFAFTGSLASGRGMHMAARLNDGRVIVAGGNHFDTVTPDYTQFGEVYDPAIGKWSTYAPMASKRVFGTMTVLPSGDVLVVGGMVTPDSAEVWAPDAFEWVPTASPNQPRLTHHAALLMDGRVLIAGGESPSQQKLSSAELFGSSTALGVTCSFNGECTSGHCVDGVCCEDACGGDPKDCMACSVAQGSSTDGMCEIVADGTSCKGHGTCVQGSCEPANEGGAGGTGGFAGAGGLGAGGAIGGTGGTTPMGGAPSTGGSNSGGGGGAAGGPNQGGDEGACGACAVGSTGDASAWRSIALAALFAASRVRRRARGRARLLR